MNTFCFDNFDIGLKALFKSEITLDKMNHFLAMCEDENPMHMIDEYAQNKGFKSRLVYGMLTASLYSTLVGMYLPGEKCILKSVEAYFQKPVYRRYTNSCRSRCGKR